MEDAKKMDETTKSEELAERVELTDEQLDQASGGVTVGYWSNMDLIAQEDGLRHTPYGSASD